MCGAYGFSVKYEPDKINYPKPPHPWHYFQLKDQKIFAFAGLYDIWTDKATGKEIHSYTIITTMSNEIVGKYHERMPVILERGEEEKGIFFLILLFLSLILIS
jgi:putative SOS response-associated peptidase YedK